MLRIILLHLNGTNGTAWIIFLEGRVAAGGGGRKRERGKHVVCLTFSLHLFIYAFIYLPMMEGRATPSGGHWSCLETAGGTPPRGGGSIPSTMLSGGESGGGGGGGSGDGGGGGDRKSVV